MLMTLSKNNDEDIIASYANQNPHKTTYQALSAEWLEENVCSLLVMDDFDVGFR